MFSHISIRILALTSLVWCAKSYNMLLAVADMTSHVIYFGKMAEILRMRGHDVTLLLPSKLKIPGNVLQMDFNSIIFDSPGQSLVLTKDFKTLAHDVSFSPSLSLQLKMKNLVFNSMKDSGEQFFKDKRALELVEAGHFEFIIVDPAMLPYFFIPYKLDIPYAYLGMDCMGPLHRIPVMPSYVPNLMTSYTDKMDFQERIVNFLLHSAMLFYYFGGYEESRRFVPEKPQVGYNDLFLNASLCLQLRDNVIDFIKPLMPDVIPVGSLMAREAKPLQTDLQSYMDQSTNGVILVSFGTMVAEIHSEVISKMIKAFKNVDYNVIFRYPLPANLTNIPFNIRVMSWVPQNDILGHSNMKLFITHCGMNSIIEAFYHGVPVIGFPHRADQLSNAALAKAKGVGEVIAIDNFTSDELQTLINRIIIDQKYCSAAKNLSTVYKDILVHASSDPVYWIEHVIKFGDRYLRSHAVDMPMYQYLMIDVIAFLVLSSLVVVATLLVICHYVIAKICCHRRESKVQWFLIICTIGPWMYFGLWSNSCDRLYNLSWDRQQMKNVQIHAIYFHIKSGIP